MNDIQDQILKEIDEINLRIDQLYLKKSTPIQSLQPIPLLQPQLQKKIEFVEQLVEEIPINISSNLMTPCLNTDYPQVLFKCNLSQYTITNEVLFQLLWTLYACQTQWAGFRQDIFYSVKIFKCGFPRIFKHNNKEWKITGDIPIVYNTKLFATGQGLRYSNAKWDYVSDGYKLLTDINEINNNEMVKKLLKCTICNPELYLDYFSFPSDSIGQIFII